MPFKFSGRFLVQGNSHERNPETTTTTTKISSNDEPCPILYSNVSLSFWGGIDPETGIVIDKSHPLAGKCVADTILCLPSGRGSCTASQVLLELILNQKAPKALLLRDRDGLMCVGALIAQSIFPNETTTVLNILQVKDFEAIGQTLQKSNDPTNSSNSSNSHEYHAFGYGHVFCDGSVVVSKDRDEIVQVMKDDYQQQQEPTSTQTAATNPSSSTFNLLDSLALTDEEQEMLDAAKTKAEIRAVQCLIRYAHIISDAPTYVSVEKGHIDGCTYIGPGGLKFVQRLVQEGGNVCIPTTLNSVSTDLRHWKTLGIVPTTSQQASIELANAYLQLGCSEQSFTCAPYLLESPPTFGQQIVWGESNAVVFANSVLGARTEKYADYLDICCSIVGKVPAVGVHLDENRSPNVLIDFSTVHIITDNSDSFALLFPILGHLCGSLADGEVPLVIGLEQYANQITMDHMKSFCAAFGTTGTSPLIHVAGITPEAKDPNQVQRMTTGCKRKRIVTESLLDETYRILNQQEQGNVKEHANSDPDKIDWIALGNPHLSLSECDALVELIESLPKQTSTSTERPRKHEDVQIVACMSRVLYDQSPAIPTLRKFGMEFVRDTCWCMLLEPPMIPSDTNATILTNSGKYAHYGPGLTGRKFRLGSMKDCIQAAVSGTLSSQFHNTILPWKTTTTRSWSSLAHASHDTSTTMNRRFSTFSWNQGVVPTSRHIHSTQWLQQSCRWILSHLKR